MSFLWKFVLFYVLTLDSISPLASAIELESKTPVSITKKSAHKVANFKVIFVQGVLTSPVEALKELNQAPELLSEETELVLLREISLDDLNYVLAVQPRSLVSYLILQSSLGESFQRSDLNANLPYFKLLRKAAHEPIAEFTANPEAVNGKIPIVLSLDFCPSVHRADFDFIEHLPNYFSSPNWIAFMSGKWIKAHPQELQRLVDLNVSGKQQIIFANHSFQHPHKAPFIADSKLDFKADTLKAEEVFLERGIAPAMFYRFPGLISNTTTLNTLNSLGYIAISSKAWIAKRQLPVKGSIVLLHGNGNEKNGINEFKQFLAKHPHEYELIDLYHPMGF